MSLTVHDNLVQGSDQWLDVRRGMITASTVGQLISTRKLSAAEVSCPACLSRPSDPCMSKRSPEPIKTMHPERTEAARTNPTNVIETATGDTARGLTLLLAAERITGWTEPTYVSDDMMRGQEDEPVARGIYAETYAPVQETGFMVEDKWGFQIGYSPDGLVGESGLIEIKSRRPKNHLATIIADQIPAENMAQLMCGLLVSGREWCDYVSYCAGMRLWTKRVYPDRQWFDAIIEAVAAFEQNAADIINTYHASTATMPTTEREPRPPRRMNPAANQAAADNLIAELEGIYQP